MRKLFIYLFIIICSLGACIEQIEFDSDSQGSFVVVDAHFTTLMEKQKVTLAKSVQLNSQVPIPLVGANVIVESDDGNQIPFLEELPGTYVATAMANQGNQYRLKATLADGTVISSNYQGIPDSLSITGIETQDTSVTFTNGSGRYERDYLLNFYATAGASKLERDLYLRYNTNTVYQVLARSNRCR